jgi:acetyltransferase
MAFIAVSEKETPPKEYGVARYIVNPDARSVEFALVVSDDCQCLGIGTRLMKTLMRTAKYKGIAFIEGEVLATNKPMLSFVGKLGFSIEEISGDHEVVRVVKDLRQ